jgi:CheY-like chemotaxis protein
MNGLDSLKILKESEETKNIPFILVSAVAEKAIFEQALSLGAKSCIPRPLSMDVVTDHVIEALRQNML